MSTSKHIFAALQRLGAGEFAHINGSLEAHLRGTELLLRSWQAQDYVCHAGLFHAAYGTSGFATNMISLSLRNDVRTLIGTDAELLVYLYCACDRDKFYPCIGTDAQHHLPDRFLGKLVALDDTTFSALCELTAANELEIAASNTHFRARYGDALLELFNCMGSNLSSMASEHAQHVLGTPH